MKPGLLVNITYSDLVAVVENGVTTVTCNMFWCGCGMNMVCVPGEMHPVFKMVVSIHRY